jgi:hypothetical protein
MSSTSGIPAGGAPNDPAPASLVMPGRRVRAGEGAAWIADGWRLFRKATLMWIIFLVLFCLLHLALGIVPYAGNLLGSLLSPILLGGIALGCRSLETGGEFEMEHLLAGFRRNTGYLFAIGVVYALGELTLLGVMGLFAGFPLVFSVLSGDAEAMMRAVNEADLLMVALGALVALALAVPLLAAFWFAPTLAMLHGMPALQAMKASLRACLRNILPMLVYGLLMGVLLVVALVPLALGLLAWLPVMVATSYTSYRSIFTEPDGDAPAY